jgi:hypothetical protein
MVRSALIMRSRFNEVRHHFKDPTKPFVVPSGKFFLKKLEEENVFKFLLFRPMSFFLIGYKIVNWGLLYMEWQL